GEPVELILTPRDRAGNLLGPSKADRFTLSVRGEGAVIGGIVDRWDGSYLVRVARAQPTTMTLVLQIGSVEQAIRLPRRLEILYFTQPIRRLVARLIAWWRVRAARSKWPKELAWIAAHFFTAFLSTAFLFFSPSIPRLVVGSCRPPLRPQLSPRSHYR